MSAALYCIVRRIVLLRCLYTGVMVNLGLIDFKLGVFIEVNVNKGQSKFEVHISKHLAKMAIN